MEGVTPYGDCMEQLTPRTKQYCHIVMSATDCLFCFVASLLNSWTHEDSSSRASHHVTTDLLRLYEWHFHWEQCQLLWDRERHNSAISMGKELLLKIHNSPCLPSNATYPPILRVRKNHTVSSSNSRADEGEKPNLTLPEHRTQLAATMLCKLGQWLSRRWVGT